MKNRKIIIGIVMLCASTLMISCSSSKRSGCYYSDENIKELPIEKKSVTRVYTIAE